MRDLLGRPLIGLSTSLSGERIAGRIIFITGAAGSIGSEMCRQISRFSPAAIVGFDNSETASFYLEEEMRKSFPNIRFHAEIGNIQNLQRVEEAMGAHSPAMIFHAAAYEHVPMMEAHNGRQRGGKIRRW